MKRLLFSTMLLASFSSSVMAQDVYDLARLSSQDLSGTAKFVGMGGALSALGGDMTTMGTNPAGLGIFRRSDVSTSISMNMLNNKGQLRDNRVSYDQLGVVISQHLSDYSSIRYLNYGFNYRKVNNLFDSFSVTDNNPGDFSQTFQMAEMTYNENSTQNMPALARIAVESGVVIDNGQDYEGVTASRNTFNTIQTGGIHAFDASVAGNWNDQLFLGMTVGVNYVSLDRSSYYREDGTDGTSYDLYNSYRTRGSGINLKLGGIYRPLEDSGFRMGLSIQTPTFYDLEDSNSADMALYNENNQQIGRKAVDIDPVSYKVITPWKFNFSLGHTLGNMVAIGAEYELTTLQSMRLREYDNSSTEYTLYVDDTCRDFLKPQHTVRVGLEVKPIPEISLRAGYNYQTAAFSENAYRSLIDFTDMGIDSFTDTQYENTLSLNRITAGVGFRFDDLYFDMSYQYTTQQNHFYAFDDYYTDNSGSKHYLPTTLNDKGRHQLMCTVGFRF